jgi:hypothetical protein
MKVVLERPYYSMRFGAGTQYGTWRDFLGPFRSRSGSESAVGACTTVAHGPGLFNVVK